MALTRRGRLTVLAVVAVVMVAILGGGAFAAVQHFGGSTTASGPKDYAGDGTGRVVVQVTKGDTATAIAQTLAGKGVVASVDAFVQAATANPKSTSIQPGVYALRMHMSGAAAVALLLTPAAEVTARVTIPEGASVTTRDPGRNIPALVAAATHIPLAQLHAAIAAPSTLGLPSYAAGNVQGFLFPATYNVPPGSTATQALRLMTARFAQAATDTELVAGAQARGLTPLQVVTLASIIQGESASAADGPKVARTFYNRIQAGLPLGSEFTVNFAGNDPASPYNTYTHKGIPPAPFDSPGQEAITSALHPASGTYLFFITLPQEGDVFVNTEKEFFDLQAKCKAEGGCTG